jgi:hypothetical protein
LSSCYIQPSNCLLGEESINGICSNCSVGRYKNVTGDSLCIACEAGRYQSLNASTSCITCPSGYYCPLISSAIGSSTPSVCYGGNSTSGGTSLLSCNRCYTGYYSRLSSNGWPCTSCAAGNYSDSLASIECKKCPAGNLLNQSRHSHQSF